MPKHDRAVQILSELRAVEHHEWAPADRGNSLRRAETEAHECFVVVAEAQTVVRLDELLDPFEIGGRRQFDEFLQGQRRVGNNGLVATIGDVLLDERVEKLDRGADGGSLVSRNREIDRDYVGAAIEDLIVSLAKKFRDARRWFHEQQQTATRFGGFRLGQDPVELRRATDKVLLDHTAENAAEIFACDCS